MPTHRVALITDSVSDVPDDLLERYDIDMVPLYVIWGQEQMRDRVELAPQAFYQRLTTDPIHPKTSQPSPQDFAAAFERARAGGAQEAVVVAVSTAMSQTLNAARRGAEIAAFPIHEVDTKANTMGQGWQVIAAARARESGGDAAAMVEAAAKARSTLATMVYVDTLEYLHRGGRIGGAASLVGTLLDLKPQILVNHETGLVEPGARTRTRGKAIEAAYQSFFAKMKPDRPLHIAVMHANVPDLAQEIADRIRREYASAELIVALTSAVLGTHIGPGAIALCGYYE